MKLLLSVLFIFIASPLTANEDCVDCGSRASGLQVASVGNNYGKLTSAVQNSFKLADDPALCFPLEEGDFGTFHDRLRDRFNTSLEESYFEIRCSGKDILSLVVESSVDRKFIDYHLQKYFIKKIKKPEIFSRMLLNKTNARNILQRIDAELEMVRGDSSLKPIYEQPLLKMKKRYEAHLRKYPLT